MDKVFSFLNVSYHHFQTMSRMFENGWSANKVQEFMSNIGAGYRRSTVQAVKRKVLDLVKKEGLIAGLDNDRRPTKGFITDMSWERPYKYKLYGSVDVIDEDTGEIHSQPISMYFDDVKSKNEYIREMYAQLNVEKYGVNISFGAITIRQIQHRQDLPF